jgi:hypothetical protein
MVKWTAPNYLNLTLKVLTITKKTCLNPAPDVGAITMKLITSIKYVTTVNTTLMKRNKITRVCYYKLLMDDSYYVTVDTTHSNELKELALTAVMCRGFLLELLKKARRQKAEIKQIKKQPFAIAWL